MSRRITSLLIGCALLISPPDTASSQAPPSHRLFVQIREAASAMMALRLEDADRELTALLQSHPTSPDVQFERALLHYYRGQYTAATRALDAASDAQFRPPADRDALASIIRATARATAAFETQTSEDGRYEVRFAPGPDAILVPYALETMRATDRALSEEFDLQVPGPIRLEIYPTAASLSNVSSLSVQAIETTGTIALCKWDRIMITSPRALQRGYPWLDTIGHELVHLFLSRASHDLAPVWFQEGMAKVLERRWRGEAPSARLDPASSALLARAVQNDTLLGFEQLHPSIAQLPSQEAAALAFAQVATFIEGVRDAHGQESLRQAIRAMAQGTDARQALAEATGTPFSRLERDWQRALRTREAPEGDAPRTLRRRLNQQHAQNEDLSEIPREDARRHTRLGDLLWDHGRPEAAAVEYGRAHALVPDDPIVASRLARAALEGGRPQEAIDALTPFRERYPDHAPTWVVSGTAWLRLGNEREGIAALHEALRLNPFDPAPHCELASVLTDDVSRQREERICSRLASPRP